MKILDEIKRECKLIKLTKIKILWMHHIKIEKSGDKLANIEGVNNS